MVVPEIQLQARPVAQGDGQSIAARSFVGHIRAGLAPCEHSQNHAGGGCDARPPEPKGPAADERASAGDAETAARVEALVAPRPSAGDFSGIPSGDRPRRASDGDGVSARP